MTTMTGDQLEALERERIRLEVLLEADPNWRMLADLVADGGEERFSGVADPTELQRSLETVLATNRYYLARRKIVEAIAILREAAAHEAARSPGRDELPRPPPPEVAAAITRAQRSGIADRMVLLQPVPDAFRTKLKVKDVAAPDGDDPTRIRGIDAATAIVSAPVVAQPAAPTPEVSPRDATPVAAQPPPIAASAPVPAAGVAAPAVRPDPDRRDLIRGIDAMIARRLEVAGIVRFADIAGWTASDLAHWRGELGAAFAPAREGWIEQAAVLAVGRDTAHARKVRGGLVPELAAVPGAHLGLARDLLSDAATPLARSVTEAVGAPVATPGPSASEPGPIDPVERLDPAPVLAGSVAATLTTPELRAIEEEPPEIAAEPAPPPLAPPTPPPLPRKETMSERLARLERELAVLDGMHDTDRLTRPSVPGAAPAALRPPPLPVAPPAPLEPRVAGRLPRNIEDEEFPQLHVGEADVVIRPRERRVLPELAETEPAAAAWLRAEPVAPIDGDTYAGYQSQIEEASVEIVKRAAASTDATGDIAAAQSAVPRAPGMRRFFKALNGD